MGKLEWEPIESPGYERPGDRLVHRAKVHGGWLVSVMEQPRKGMGLAFLPDPQHKWTADETDS